MSPGAPDSGTEDWTRFWTRVAPDEPVLDVRNVRLYEASLLVLMTGERLRECWDLGVADRENVHLFASLALLAGYAAVLMLGRPAWRRVVVAGFAGIQLAAVSHAFPWTGNHLYLALYLLLLGVVFDLERPEERRLLVAATRWIVVTVFFFAGFQKVVHGMYFRGETLSYLITFYDNFELVLGPLLPAAELERLTSYAYEEGAGPFRTTSPFLLLLSNATYLTEIGTALGLLWPRTRALALAAGVGFLIVTEAMALELYFGMIFVNALLLFAPRPVHRFALIPGGALLLWILLMRFGVLPAVVHT